MYNESWDPSPYIDHMDDDPYWVGRDEDRPAEQLLSIPEEWFGLVDVSSVASVDELLDATNANQEEWDDR